MSETKGKRGRRSRSAGLRKYQPVENVLVEESFAFQNGKEKAGEGVYVSATTSANRRFYGVLIDQPALKEASSMYFQDQADSLELNRRMKLLMKKQRDENQTTTTKTEDQDRKAPSIAKDVTESNNDSNDREQTHEKLSETDIKKLPVEAPPATAENGNEKTPDPSTTTTALGNAKRPMEDGASDGNLAKRMREMETASKNNITSGSVMTSNPDQEAFPKKTPPTTSTSLTTTAQMPPPPPELHEKPVQKFRYVMDQKPSTTRRGASAAEDPGYRILVATFSNIYEASGGDATKMKMIEDACEAGGDCLPGDDTYYYQYEVLPATLNSEGGSNDLFEMRTSMGFHHFLQNTVLPPWFPLSNLQLGSHKVLSMLHMKRDNNGNIRWDDKPQPTLSTAEAIPTSLAGGTRLPMQPREKPRYEVCVIGGGIAGLSCCQELMTLLEKEGIDAKVTLLEARSRLGGRLWTDRTFQMEGDESVPIELGASWIHGIDDNPLAALAMQADIDFVTASEEVQMLGEGLKRIDSRMDLKMGKLFDELLDNAADDCWGAPESAGYKAQADGHDPQEAVRWYSSIFVEEEKKAKEGGDSNTNGKNTASMKRSGAPTHRRSSDRSIDFEVGRAIAKRKVREFSKFSIDEHRMLLWNTKNIEYALGANISDLSMKYWDADERHAFEGDHVLLKQGYSSVIDFMVERLSKVSKDKFEYILDFPVGKVEYARKSATQAYGRDRLGRARKLLELSDTCSVSSQDKSKTMFFDFIVCAVPLGVLKESTQRAAETEVPDKLSFQPCLPFSKIDAISNVGFGLLDKAFLRFPTAFWRACDLFKDDEQCLFGNVSGVNPHHYMFFDVGRCLGSGKSSPPILMSLISGKEAVGCERLTDKEYVDEVLVTLRTIFPESMVPEPTDFRFTRWGKDKFSRGSYTFLPPGATDQDFQLLQSPINGNGDSLLLDASESMRLFFAGEHTTALHPSMAHGAMLSGLRAAKEVVSTLKFSFGTDKEVDRLIPVALFRHKFPSTELRCNLCQKSGGQVREGSLLAFKRGARQVLVHNNCAEYSPEVEVIDGKWRNVVKAVNRGKLLNCNLCKKNGATMGCSAENCFRVFHFSCSEDTGWRFDRDGKLFYCDLHRKLSSTDPNNCDRVSLKFFLTKAPVSELFCNFCGASDESPVVGKILCFQSGRRRLACVHENCIKFTSIVDTSEVEGSRVGHEYHNVFQALDRSKVCSKCTKAGATVGCSRSSCEQILHVECAKSTGWNFERRGEIFRCDVHRNSKLVSPAKTSEANVGNSNGNGQAGFPQHDLLARFGAMPTGPRVDIASNLDIGGTKPPAPSSDDGEDDLHENADSDDSVYGANGNTKVLDLPLSLSNPDIPKLMVRVERSSRREPWKIALKVSLQDGKRLLTVAGKLRSQDDIFSLREGDTIESIGDTKIGSGDLKTLREVLSRLKQETDLTMEVIRK